MTTWASLAAEEAARASGASTGILHFVTPGILDGFAAGALLTGVCLLAIVAPRMRRRSRLSASADKWSGRMRHARARPDYFAAPADGASFGLVATDPADQPAASAFAAGAASGDYARTPGSDPHPPTVGAAASTAPETGAGHFNGEAGDEIEWPLADELSHPDDGRTGYRSKHRLTEPDHADRRPEARRPAPRHAAPSARFGTWMSNRSGVSALAVRG